MRLLWIGDAVSQTGFARVTHNVVGSLKEAGWDAHVLGVNYMGDPHKYGYPIYPAHLGGDSHGVGRTRNLIEQLKPNVVVILNDPWIIHEYLPHMLPTVPVVAYMPIDAPNQRAARYISSVRAVTYTNFGKKQLILGGFNGRVDVIPHGVDTSIYFPEDRNLARKRLKFKDGVDPSSLFIVGNVNRNQPRKRLDLTIQYWTQWWINAGQPKYAYLYLHCSNMDEGWNLRQLAQYYGIDRQLIITNDKMTTEMCVPEAQMRFLYSMFDVQINTSMGEGWALTNHEGMACRVPQILSRYAGAAEWAENAAHFVDVTSFAVTPKGINTIGGIPDMHQFVEAIEKFHSDKDYRKEMADRAYVRATEPRFDWKTIGQEFNRVLSEAAMERQSAPVGVEVP